MAYIAPRSLEESGRVLGFTPEKHFTVRPTRKRYYTTRVVRYWYVTGTEEQQLHKIPHWSNK